MKKFSINKKRLLVTGYWLRKVFSVFSVSSVSSVFSVFSVGVALTSCNDYLDKLPDDRATVDTETKVNKLLTDCYPYCSSDFLGEMSSDNVGDYAWFSGNDNVSYTHAQNQMYRFEDVTDEDWDTPYWLWKYYYKAVATANTVIDNIREIGSEGLVSQEAEARLCRAYSMMKLAETFCMAYDPTKADEYLGLPYPTTVSSELNPQYERGTLGELFANIAADIEWAIGGDEPRLDENHYTVPKYHFNMKAAYAFAARFYLYYQNWKEAVKYATKALGTEPKTMLREMSTYANQSTGAEDIYNMYIRTSENCNLMLQAAYSLQGRRYVSSYYRFNHNTYIESKETYGGKTIFGMGSSGLFYWPNMMYYSGTQGPATFFPNVMEKFEYADKVAGTGTPHIVDAIFTGDETILVRAEANAILGNTQASLDDLNLWALTHTKEKAGTQERFELTQDTINGWFDNARSPIDYCEEAPASDRMEWFQFMTPRKRLHPQGFADKVPEGSDTENLLQIILQFRRLETMAQGLRFYDLKRYGIYFVHYLFEEDPVVIEPGDLRLAIQIPLSVVNAGIEANPRKEVTE